MMREPAGLGTSCLSASRVHVVGYLGILPPLFETKADRADRVVPSGWAWEFRPK
jgi:hypothetical protein